MKIRIYSHFTFDVTCGDVTCYQCKFSILVTVAAIGWTIRRITHASSQTVLVRSRLIGDISNSVARVSANTSKAQIKRLFEQRLHVIALKVTGQLCIVVYACNRSLDLFWINYDLLLELEYIEFQYSQTMTDAWRAIRGNTNAIHLTPIGHILPVSISRSRFAHLNSVKSQSTCTPSETIYNLRAFDNDNTLRKKSFRCYRQEEISLYYI